MHILFNFFIQYNFLSVLINGDSIYIKNAYSYEDKKEIIVRNLRNKVLPQLRFRNEQVITERTCKFDMKI